MDEVEDVKQYRIFSADGDVLIRDMEDSDLMAIHDWMTVEEYKPFIRVEPNAKPISSVDEIPEEDTVIRPVVVYRGETQGWISFVPDIADPTAGEVGIFMGVKENWGKGIGPKAMRMFLDILFKEEGIRVVFITTQDWNDRSKRMFDKLGFREAGRLRKMEVDPNRPGEYGDLVMMDVLREEWLDQGSGGE